jgi:site-specific DNA recombinase
VRQKGFSEMNAIIYTRVSTEEQAEKGYSLESQIKACREYAFDHSMNIVAEIKDDYTGSTLDRPGFNELESLLAHKEANAIMVTEDDRLSRNAANTLAIYEEWEEAGIELHYCDKGRVSFGEESILINGVPVLVAQYERVKTRKRTMKGRYDKARAGAEGGPRYFRMVHAGQWHRTTVESAGDRREIERTRRFRQEMDDY